MRRVELLIDMSRNLSQNTRYDADSGVPQKVFVQYFQNAQDLLVREIINAKTKYFLKTSDPLVTVVNNQEDYSYPSDIFLQGIDTIEWTDDEQTFLFLEKNVTKDRTTSINGYPYGYLLKRNSYVLTPPLASGWLRITYNRAPRRLEKRSGEVQSVTGTPITSINLDVTDVSNDEAYLNQFNYISIVDRNGVTKVDRIPISGVSGGVITVDNYTLQSGETIVAGDYVLAGAYSTNLPEYDDMCESFLILHATYQAKYGDSSQWSEATLKDVSNHMNQIITAFKTMPEDVSHVPIINTDYLGLWTIFGLCTINALNMFSYLL